MAVSVRLFNQVDVDEEWQRRRESVEKDARRVTDQEILSTDVDVISERLSVQYRFDVPDVSYEDLSADPPTFPRDSDQGEIWWHIPISGDGRLFGYHHQSRPMSPQYDVSIDDAIMKVRTAVRRDRLAQAKDKLKEVLDQIRQYLPDVQHILRVYNDRFAQFAKDVLEKRKEELIANKKAAEDFASLGIAIRKRTDDVAKVFIPVERKPLKVPDSPKELEKNPFIQQQAYEDIVQTINAMAHGIERSPHTFVDMDEEDIRIILLIGLNAVYEGKASGETFNGDGKTDILIRAGDKNVFIAECAIWDGEEYFQKKIRQLFGYTMWRDSKTALIMFNRTQNLSRVVGIMRSTLTAHPQYVRQIEPTTDTSSRYIFRRHDDPERVFTLTALAFDVPQ